MIRWLGAATLMAGCAGFGLILAAAHRREMRMLCQLIHALQEMEWELKFRMTQLPELCRIAADASGGGLRDVFLELGGRLDRRETEDISGCLNGILMDKDLPASVRRNMKQLGRSLGRFDLEGQLQGLQAVRNQCRKDLQKLNSGSDQRIRNYQVLAFCAGAALVILLV